MYPKILVARQQYQKFQEWRKKAVLYAVVKSIL